MEGNQYLHIPISKHIIIENSLSVAIYGRTYNIMYTILVGEIYCNTRHLHATFPHHTYCCIYIHAILFCNELCLRSINVIDCQC